LSIDRHTDADRLLIVCQNDLLRTTLAAHGARTSSNVSSNVWSVSTLDKAIVKLRDNGGAVTILLVADAVAGSHRTACGDLLASLSALSQVAPESEVIVIADRELDMETCCEAVRRGVVGIVDARDGALDESALHRRINEARRRADESRARSAEFHFARSLPCDTLVWQSSAMASVLSRAARAGQVSDLPVLIHGESGTGKQLLAELIHQLDPKRCNKRFLAVNCSAITGTLAESALFGHVRGAFTGATEARKGHFRAADGGTLLLDEIGEMDVSLQPKLLRVLQDGKVLPLGSDDEVDVDVRVIAATNRRLGALVEEGKFRLDLYQRLNVITLEIPPLRERPEDVPALVQFFVKKYADYYKQPIEGIEPEVLEHLTRCTLRGNVRELENTVRQMLAFKTSGNRLAVSDVPKAIREPQHSAPDMESGDSVAALQAMADAACRLVDSGALSLPELIRSCEKMVLRSRLQSAYTTSAELADQLGLSRRTLYNKLQKYALPMPSQTGASALPANQECDPAS